MEQAQRLQRIPPYPFREIAALKTQMIAEGREPLDFGIGDPDVPTPQFVIDALCAAANDAETHPYDESGFGTEEYKRSIADFAKRRFGIEVDPAGEIQSTLGAKEALVHIVWAYIDPSDVVLVPDPAYSVYKAQTRWCGGAAFPMPLDPQNDFLPDYDALPMAVRQDAKMLFINYPNNPTGAVAPFEFLERTVEFAHQYDLVVVQDAAYSEVYYDSADRPHSILEVEGAKDVAIEMHSLSKTFNMTGWRAGWAMGGRAHVEALSRTKSNVDSGTFMAIQRAGIAALEHYDEWVSWVRAQYQERRDALVAGLQSLAWPVQPPKATFYLWAPVPRGYTSIDFAKALLQEAGVLTIAGTAYGDCGEGFVRWSLTIQAEDKLGTIERAVEAIKTNLPGLSW